MSVQVLVASMNQKNHDLIKKMNINSSAIVGNQCDHNSIDEFEYNGYKIKYLNFSERGVGLNRNNCLMRADANYCLFADDDMIYVDDYVEIVENAFRDNPEADVIIFNLIEDVKKRYVIEKKFNVNYLNYLRFGTARVAIKLKSIKENGIYFNQCFGGGTEHCHGEDNLFLTSCLNKKLKIIGVPIYIAKLTEERESTWDTKDMNKYLSDQGFLYKKISPKYYKILCLQNAYKRRKFYKKNVYESYKIMINGAKKG